MSQTNPSTAILISTDRNLLNVHELYEQLRPMPWAESYTCERLQRAIDNTAVVIGAYDQAADGRLVGFARVVSDCATFGYLTDVFVDEAYRGQGLSKQMMQTIKDHPDLQGLRRFMLITGDAHGLYAQYGFEQLQHAEKWMEIFTP
ncbi:acetyltransferase (GNAT) family protein [Paenibacillus cellulosilyticus]|uniref:Acetyltransferase (GNAT) family protein n=1 Tax=Paenibacillus cellulosilyticus TaxID=375489 RepID=A0A2V2YY36_9BACL|nr:GNAT family N-acetyltransferase [Paenibacillus cellulosilyticus]PWW05210.1 acetyltransferase (GNAT) family protein [Paenibacillus cellulosilyticus]QKS43534.1 GNAT family N-acetyltransferase [Paenibacillus cellulosilyticus]